ncbi:MAG TPA: phospholipase D-like domain-containing protein [Gemmatimonadales bacterium]|nr:phospholipase D-like domain-containing protein [Gemmatimonadales bacterium]
MTPLDWLQWILVAVGAIAIVATFTALFVPDFYTPPVRCATKPEPGSEEFLAAFSRYFNAPVLRGGTVELLQNGCRFYPAMLDAIRNARETVNFQVYIFESKGIGQEFIAAFEERARAGVEVRVLLDGFGSIRFRKRDRNRLRRAGVKLEFFRPLTPPNWVRVFKRDHRRAIIIDGHVAFTGGAAVSDKWNGDARNENEWRDSMTRITGSLVDGVQTAFGENWFYRTGEILAGEKFYPLAVQDVAAPQPLGRGPVGIALVSSPADAAQPMRILMWLSLATARRRIWISNSYFVPEDAVRKIIMQRARDGLDVRLLVPGPHTDAKPVRLAGRSHYEALLEAGARIFEFQPSMMHGKTVVVDGEWCVVGSANMDKRSTRLNEENVFGISDAGFAEQVERGLLADFQRSKEIKLEDMRSRGPGQRLLEWASRLLVEQY